ncbi:MAG: nuclear transport factor 2 family protein [Acidimicrobiales bacterium]
MTARLERARNLYMRGIRDGDISVVAEHTGDVYIQHSAGVADGVEGFTRFFEEFLERNPDREIDLVRSFEDANGVFVHAHQILNGGHVQWVTMDWFRFDDDDKIIEHWDVIAPYSAKNPSGRSSVDGQTEVTDEGQGSANAELVAEAIRNLLMAGGDREAGLDVISDDYIQHNAEVGDGRSAFAEKVRAENSPLVYQQIHRICANGDFVAVLSEATFDGRPYAQGDLFRVEKGLIAEHWDVAEAIAPEEEWANTGKF